MSARTYGPTPEWILRRTRARIAILVVGVVLLLAGALLILATEVTS